MTREIVTGKSVIRFPHTEDDSHGIVTKTLMVHEEPWIGYFRNEVVVNTMFLETEPPVPAPKMLSYDLARFEISFELIDGSQVVDARMPGASVSPELVESLLSMQQAIQAYEPPPDHRLMRTTFVDRFERERRRGRLPGGERELGLASSTPTPLCFQHGDFLPMNVLRLRTTGEPALLDWEYAGLYPPGWDAALLSIALHDVPEHVTRIERSIRDRSGPAELRAFRIARALLLAREIRLQRQAGYVSVAHLLTGLYESVVRALGSDT